MAIIFIFHSIIIGCIFTNNLVLAESSKIVSVYSDGRKRVQATNLAKVGDVLKKLKINVNEGDIVEPGINTTISSGFFNINVYRARNVILLDGTKSYHIKTALKNSSLIAKKVGIKVYPEDKYESRAITDFVSKGMPGQEIFIERARLIKLKIDDKVLDIRTQAKTVDDFINEKKIKLGDKDSINPKVNTVITNNMQLEIKRTIDVVTTVDESIPRPITNIYDFSKPVGYKEVQVDGIDGSRRVTYLIHYEGGKEVGRQILQIENKLEPLTSVVVIGRGIGNDVWYRLRMCESGNNYQRNSGNGYYGAYQFALSTWWANGGVGYPNEASPELQDQIAKKIQARSGWLPWPGCSIKLGLL